MKAKIQDSETNFACLQSVLREYYVSKTAIHLQVIKNAFFFKEAFYLINKYNVNIENLMYFNNRQFTLKIFGARKDSQKGAWGSGRFFD